VLHVAALGANGPGWLGQSILLEHCAPVMLHVPTAGQWTRSNPGVGHDRLVMLQWPGTLVQSEFCTHDRPAGLSHVPGVGEHCADELHDVAAGYAQVPSTFGQVAAEVQEALGGLLQVPFWDGQLALVVQDAPPMPHVPFWAGQSVLSVQAAPPTLHVPLPGVCEHCAAEVQAWPTGVTHVPLLSGQVAAEVQDAKGALLQLPGVTWHCADDVHIVAAGFTQNPAGAHGFVVPLQAAPVRLHVPPCTAQLAAVVHDCPSTLQWPTGPQSAAPMQLAPLMLHAPGWAGQFAFDVQLAWVILQLPGSGVQTGGAHVVTGVQGFSGSGGSRLHPGGL
jgi:hypothetical protein